MPHTADREEQRPSLPRPRQRALAGALVLCLIGLGLWQVRKSFIRSWFLPGEPQELTAVQDRAGAALLRPTRVLLLDGLSAEVADVLPGVSRVCGAGLSLTVEVGFPAVSLPVQHALWTGSWQNQSGVLFQTKRMERPVFESLPTVVAQRGGRSVAVVESYPEIAGSFPFAVVSPAGPVTRPPRRMSAAALRREALVAARSDAALVFVHLLGVDKAGHKWGAADPRYLAAARAADRVVQAVWAARSPEWSVMVLSDHGHLRGPGGHGGTEEEVARVRACLAGPGIKPGSSGAAAMVDLTRLLSNALGVRPPRRCQGRGLSQVLGATSPPLQPPLFRFGLTAWIGIGVGALLLLLALLRLRGATPQGALLVLPWGVAASLVALVLAVGAPSLSTAYVYRMWSPHLLAAGFPALLWPVLVLWRGPGIGLERSAALLPLLTGGVAPALVLLGLTGWPAARPPLVPQLTAWSSTLLGLVVLSVFGLAAAWLALRGRSGSGNGAGGRG